MGKKRAKKDSGYRRKEETAVVVCPDSTAVISASAQPAAQPTLTRVSLYLLMHQLWQSKSDAAKSGGKYPEGTAGQISLQANRFFRLVLSHPPAGPTQELHRHP